MRLAAALLLFVAGPVWAAPCVIKKPLRLTAKSDGTGANQRLFPGAKAEVLRVTGEAAQVKSGAFTGYIAVTELHAKSTCSTVAQSGPKAIGPKTVGRALEAKVEPPPVVKTEPHGKKAKVARATPLPPQVAAPAATVTEPTTPVAVITQATPPSATTATPPPVAVGTTQALAPPAQELLTGNGARLVLFPLEGWPTETQAQANSLLPVLADALGEQYHAQIIVPDVVGTTVKCPDDACRNEVAGGLGAQRFVRGRLSRSPFGSTLSLVVVHVPAGTQEAAVDEQFQAHPADAVVSAVAHLRAGGSPLSSAPMVHDASLEVSQPVTHSAWRPAVGWPLVAVGVGALGAGVGIFIYEHSQATALATSVNNYNASAHPSPATGAQLSNARSTVATGQTVSIVVGAVGIAALGAGLAILLSGGHDADTPSAALVPTLGGGAVVGTF